MDLLTDIFWFYRTADFVNVFEHLNELKNRRVANIWALVRRTRNRIETLAGLLQEPWSAEKRTHKNMSVRISGHIEYNQLSLILVVNNH